MEYQGKLTRFLVHRSQYNSTRVKASAFSPPKDSHLSVDKTEGRTEDDIWRDRRFVRRDSPNSIVARADFQSDSIPKRLLLQDAPIDDFITHAEITGWEQFSEVDVLAFCNFLAFNSTLVKLSVEDKENSTDKLSPHGVGN